jgi:phage terminase small subunit
VNENQIDLNVTQAALRAKYTPKTAPRIVAENLQEPAIKAAIKAAQDEIARRKRISVDAILRRLWAIGDADIRELFNEKGGSP